MDPTATYTVVLDEANVELVERAVHAVDLLAWLARGGFGPTIPTGASASHADVIGTCERTILAALDAPWLTD